MQQIPPTGHGITIAVMLIVMAGAGCHKPPDMRDQRLAEFAKNSVDQQAGQNEHIARQAQAVVEESHKLAEASKELVAQDAEARREMVAAQRELNSQFNAQRTAIDSQRNALEQERREIAEQRRRDPLVAASIQTVGLVMACLLPLLVCLFIIRQMARQQPDDAAVAELLVQELTSEQPQFLPGPSPVTGIEHRDQPRRLP